MTASDAHPIRTSRGSELRLRFARERALLSLFDLGRRKGFGLRLARLYALGVCLCYAIAISLAHGEHRRAAIQSFVHAALVSISWVVGSLAALGTAQILAQAPDRDGLRALALARGFSDRDVLRARVLAAALRVALLLGVPALLLVLVALARGESLGWALVLAPGVAIYAALFGLCLALLAEFSAALAPRHARALLATLVLCPLLLSQAYPALPNLPAAFAELLDRLFALGSLLS
ncbi:MAG TPA: hypothetical protein VHV51_10675 [Polyangiaceae bacterium]|nr:hypothetical protein [Polyangiaceae bacterium]